MASLELSGVTIRKGGVPVVHDVDLSVEHGTILGVIGPSGGGKTTLLRAVAGLDRPEPGTVSFDRTDVTSMPPSDRNVAMVFQQPTLYPNRNVRRNIAFPLEVRHQPAAEIRQRVGAEARALRIEALLETSPKRLSEGEAHVVQVARAMVRTPSVLLLDEPFSTIDADLAATLRREIMFLQRGFGVTTVLATNEPLDAMTMADRLAVLEDGRVTQVADPLEVYSNPVSVAAAQVTGQADVFEVRVEGDHDGSWLVHPGFRLRAWQPALRRHAERRLQMIVRPEWWQIDEHGPATVTVERMHPAPRALWCRAGGRPITVSLDRGAAQVREGDRLTLRIDRYVLIDPLDGFRLDLG